MKKTMKVLGFMALGIGLFALTTDSAFAQGYGNTGDSGKGVGYLASTLRTSAKSVTDILSLVSYVVGVGFGIKAALKFKEHNETKGQTPISQPIVLLAVAGFLLSLPTLLNIARDSVAGTNTQGVSIDNGGLRTLQ